MSSKRANAAARPVRPVAGALAVGLFATQLLLPAAAGAQAAVAEAPARAAPATFTIAAFDVSGAKQLPQDVIEDTVYGFTGPDKSSTEVENARKALEDAYKARGFEAVQVDIPPQPEALFAQGIVQLRVTEAPIGQVNVTGTRYHSVKVVRAQVPSVAAGKVLNTKALEADLAAANRFPDRTVTPSFKAGATPGTIDVDLAVEDSLPVHGSLELSNDHGPSTEPLRLNASLRYTNLWQRGHSISGSYIVAPQDRAQTEVFSGSYSAPLIGTPWTLILYGYTSNSNVPAAGGVAVLGNGYQIGGRAVYRLGGTRLVQNLTFGLDYKNFKQNVTLASQLATQQPIEYMPLYAAYGLSGGSDKSNIDVSVSLTGGFRIFKIVRCFEVDQKNCENRFFDQFDNRDVGSHENFVHANFDLTYKRALKHDFQAIVRLNGQLSDSHLVTNEQFVVGGFSGLRGYLQAEGVGDIGYAASLELGSPSLAPKLPDFVDELRLFGFIDHAQTRILHAASGVNRSQSLISVGGGAHLKLLKHLTGELAVGVPLTSTANSRAGKARTTFSVKSEF